ncbi:MAG: rhodanese-like domain-containing protein [Ferruginibacter sp.]
MFSFFKKLFGPATDYRALMLQGAQIIDVRTQGEYRGGHIKGSVNIPLNILAANAGKIKKDKPVITCCASGMRSAQAKSILKSKGFEEVYNGGGWMGLQHKI